ncbi:hypothetical protein KEJ27_09845 [Candidatus Bathyarchaeota archaeon]|nr:hypothetical protein [Candidatus Bathyarchaeota archaeon]
MEIEEFVDKITELYKSSPDKVYHAITFRKLSEAMVLLRVYVEESRIPTIYRCGVGIVMLLEYALDKAMEMPKILVDRSERYAKICVEKAWITAKDIDKLYDKILEDLSKV